jgi:hypothetical protein
MEEIVDVLENSGPLLYMGSVLSESCEELDILMKYLSLEDEDGEKTMLINPSLNWKPKFHMVCR